MSLRPVISSAGLTEHKIIGSEQLTKRTTAHAVHSTGLEINKYRSGHIFTTTGFVIVNRDSLQLEFRVADILTGWVDTVLVRDNLPELGADLITALAGLNMNDFTHLDQTKRLNDY